MLARPAAINALVAVILVGTLAACTDQGADLVFRRGAVYTVDEDRSWAEAVAVADGRIVYVGDDDGVGAHIGSSTQVIDLAGRMLLPGFHDSHMHPMRAGTRMFRCQMYDLDWPAGVYAAIRDCAAGLGEEDWLHGVGLPDEVFEGTGPLRTVLDELVPDHPAFITTNSSFAAWANSRALAMVGLDANTPDPERGLIERDPESGEPSGTLRGPAVSQVYRLVQIADPDKWRRALKMASEMANRFGITSANAAAVWPEHVKAYRLADLAGEMTLRVQGSQYWDFKRGLEQIEAIDLRREQTAGSRFKADAAKLSVDGEIFSHTAAVLEPYQGTAADMGDVKVEADELNEIVSGLDLAGFQVHMHVVGDRAVRNGLDAIENAIQVNGPRDRRHQLAHVKLVNPADIRRFAGLGIVADIQPLWAQKDQYIEEEIPMLGRERARWLVPVASFFEAGVRVAAGSDWISDSMNPLVAIQIAVTRRPVDGSRPVWIPEERAGLAEMIEAYTINGAWLARQEAETGSIEAGKAADLIVLDQNLFQVEPMKISEVRVLLTLLDGRAVWRDPDFP
jgi:predicted amidohydrolase YtcJ